MLRSLTRQLNCVAHIQPKHSIACVQCANYGSKPRWIPQAKSKVFRVPERRRPLEEEKLELMRLHRIYRTQVRSVRSYILAEVRIKKTTSQADRVIVTPEEEAAEIKRCSELNDEWNANVAKIRNERLEIERQKTIESIRYRLEEKKLRDEEKRLESEELVRIEKERAKMFIVKENIDEAIEYALANPVDYNFAITLNDQIINGRTGGVEEIENKSAVAKN